MNRFRADLHVHTVLSPCAEVEMIPPLIVQAALEKQIDLIAITDHNASAKLITKLTDKLLPVSPAIVSSCAASRSRASLGRPANESSMRSLTRSGSITKPAIDMRAAIAGISARKPKNATPAAASIT